MVSYADFEAIANRAGGVGPLTRNSRATPVHSTELSLGGVTSGTGFPGSKMNGVMCQAGMTYFDYLNAFTSEFDSIFASRTFSPNGIQDAWVQIPPPLQKTTIRGGGDSTEPVPGQPACYQRGNCTFDSRYFLDNFGYSVSVEIGEDEFEESGIQAEMKGQKLAALAVNPALARYFTWKRVLSDGGSGNRNGLTGVGGWASISKPITGLTVDGRAATTLANGGPAMPTDPTAAQMRSFVDNIKALCRIMSYPDYSASMNKAGIVNPTSSTPDIIVEGSILDQMNATWALLSATNGSENPETQIGRLGKIHRISEFDIDPGTGTNGATAATTRTLAVVSQPEFFWRADEIPRNRPAICDHGFATAYTIRSRSIVGYTASKHAGRLTATPSTG